MDTNVWLVASVWMGLALLASMPTFIAQRFVQPAGSRFETTEEDIESMSPPDAEL